jgi:Kef-type K+ transport system membrane component KefB
MKNETKLDIVMWIATAMIVVGFLAFTFSVFTSEYDEAGQLGIIMILGGGGLALVGVSYGMKVEQFGRSIALLMEKADDLTALIVENVAEARRVLELAGVSASVIDDVINYLSDRYSTDDGDDT